MTDDTKYPRKKYVRELLLQHPEGLTTIQIAQYLGLKRSTFSDVMKHMAGTYIVAWRIPPKRGRAAAVWKLHTGPGRVPEDAHPPWKSKLIANQTKETK